MNRTPLRLLAAIVGLLLATAVVACDDAAVAPERVVRVTEEVVATAPPAQQRAVDPPQLPVAAEATPAPVVTLTPSTSLTPTLVPIEEVNFTGLVTTTNVPSQVQVVFSLRDQEGHAIVLPAEQLERALQVHERGPGTDGSWEEIDYTETSYFVHTAENIDLEVVFVLDFTNSMAAVRLSDGSSGVEAMLRAFEASLAVLPSAHRIGVVEFHDRNVRPSVLSELTTDRETIQERVNHFLASGFDSGSSRVWDSVVTGTDLFSGRQENPRAVRALVFLSDGRDTSSDSTREQAARYAQERGVQLYALGAGNVFQEPELRSAAHSTGGAYYSAHDLNLVQEQFQLLVHDLRGQYQLTYITLRRSGKYQTAITARLSGVEGATEVGPFDVASFYGADNQGIIGFDPPSFDRSNERATVFMRALHIPRNIDRIRFRVPADKQLQVELVPRGDGGLLEGWLLSGPGADGWHEVTSSSPLEFGSLGLLAKLTFSNTREGGLDIPIEFDNSIYTGGKTLAQSSRILAGDFASVPEVSPAPMPTGMGANRDPGDASTGDLASVPEVSATPLPMGMGANWDLSDASTIGAWILAENRSSLGFQHGTTWILGDTEGNAFAYWANNEILNGAIGNWVYATVPLEGSARWQRTRIGNPSFSDIDFIEIHADTWDYGFTILIDGLALGNLPADELTEGTAHLWDVYAEDGRTTTVEDYGGNVQSGRQSLLLLTEGGFDTALRYPAGLSLDFLPAGIVAKFPLDEEPAPEEPAEPATVTLPLNPAARTHWNLSQTDAIEAWVRTENPNPGGFQNGMAWILGDTQGNHFRFWTDNQLLNDAKGRWVSVTIPLAGGGRWERTEVGSPNLSDMKYIELHADTWGYGFELWVDGLALGGLPLDQLTENTGNLWEASAEDGRPARVENDFGLKKAGQHSIHLITEGGFDTSLRYPAGIGPLSVSCVVAPFPGVASEPVTWSAIPTGGDGEYTVEWRGTDGLEGRGLEATKTYPTPGMRQAWVTFASGNDVQEFDCRHHFHVVPKEFSEPPSVNPVLWTPDGVDPTPWVDQMERNLREVQAAFHNVFGKTFAMNSLVVIRSSTSEQELCGGDCEDQGMADEVMQLARREAQATVGDIIPYTRQVLVMAWGAGGWAGAFGWDIPLAGVGDWAIGGSVGNPQNPINDFHGGVYTIGHELGHNISYDDPHGNDYLRPETVGAFDRMVSEGSPWLYVTLDDTTPPEVRVDEVRRIQGSIEVVASASDNDQIEAVALIVDGELEEVVTQPPYNFRWNDTGPDRREHTITVKAYDLTGNTSQVTTTVD